MPLLPLVDFYDLLGVDGEPLVGVDDHTEEPGVGLAGNNLAKKMLTTPTHVNEA